MGIVIISEERRISIYVGTPAFSYKQHKKEYSLCTLPRMRKRYFKHEA